MKLGEVFPVREVTFSNKDSQNNQKDPLQDYGIETSLLVQWLRICLPMQGTQVGPLVQEDSTCHRAMEPAGHGY